MARRLILIVALLTLALPALLAPPMVSPGLPERAHEAVRGIPYAPQDHVDTPTADLYVAETLTSARWSTGAVKERFLGRPFWVEPVTGSGVRVAIIDTGIDPDHPDLEGSIVAWRDFLHGRPEPYDDDTHGTHVAGIIAAHGHFQPRPDRHYFPFGARGIAPGVDLIIAKAMDTRGDGEAADVAQAILWALDPNGDGDPADGAHVINLSIGLETAPPEGGGSIPSPITVPAFRTEQSEEAGIVRDAIQTAVRRGAIVVVAAGNHEPGAPDATVTFPGTMSEVLTVGALDADGKIAAFSNRGQDGSGKPDVVAPGVLLSTFPIDRDLEDSVRDGYVALGGTSMAAPMVAGTVALMLEADPGLRRLSATEDLSFHTREVKQAITRTAEGREWNPQTGHGILRVDAAVDAVDTGKGPVNWDGLALLVALLFALIGAALVRRRVRRRRSAIRLAKAEARTRYAATRSPGGGAAPIVQVGDASEERSATQDGSPRSSPPPRGASADLFDIPLDREETDGRPPPAQRAPWEGP